jgi:4-amino-4-deoxy-L-arabinose transferase-like glycosyltransferase
VSKIFKKPVFWLAVLILVHFVANIVWLSADKTPPAWDQAAHLRLTTLVGQKLIGDYQDTWLSIIRTAYGYPPLIYFIGGLWSAVVGVGIFQITFLNTLLFGGLLIGVYLVAKEVIKDDWGALLATIVFSMLPVIYDLSRNFLLDMPMLMFVTWGIWSYLRSDGLKDRKYSISWAVLLLLASLTKLNGFIYFIPMVLWSVGKLIREKDEKILVNLVMAGVIWLVGVGWWWILNFQNIAAYMTGLAGAGEPLTDPMDLLNWQTWVHYIRLFFWNQLTPLAATIAMFLMIYWNKSGVKKETKYFLWFFLVVNYMVFTVIKNKDFRFIMPLLPVVAIMIASGLQWWQQKNRLLYTGLLVTLLGYLGWFYVNNSFDWPIKKEFKVSVNSFAMGAGDIINVSDYPVKSPKTDIWPQKEILKTLVLESKENGKQKLLTLVDIEQLNDNNLKLYRDLMVGGGDKVLEIHSVFDDSFADWNSFNFVLVGERDLEPAPFYATNLMALKNARNFVWDNQGKFQVVGEYTIPNGKKIYLMRII